MPKRAMPDRCLLVVLACLALVGGALPLRADDTQDLDESLTPANEGIIDLTMYREPVIELPDHPRRFHPRLKSLWLEALAREEASTRLEAMLAFKDAFRQGMPDLGDLPARLIELVRDDPDRHVAQAAAETLHAMDHADAAAALLERAQADADADFVQMADAALAAWDHEPARAWWVARARGEAASRRLRISAIRSLAEVGESSANEALVELALDDETPVELRLAAGAALGRIAEQGLVDDARALAEAEGASVIDRLVAARMLAGHGQDAALSLAEQWTRDEDATVARRAMANVTAHDTDRAAALAPTLLSHDDANVRLAALRAMATQQTAEAVRTMAEALDDLAPAVRTFARRTLEAYDQEAALQPVVREQIEQVLASAPSWRALEQAALLAAQVDHEPAAERLSELLTHDRPEVRRASAHAMHVLAVPETLPAILARAEQLAGEEPESQDARRHASEEATLLFHAIGRMRYAEADDVLRRYVPKNSGFSSVSRSAAIWALGRVHEGESRPGLARALIGRVTDQSMMEPESLEVQQFSAIALGRLDAPDQVSALRRTYESGDFSERLRAACRWALEQLTDESFEPLPERPKDVTGWFLEPLD